MCSKILNNIFQSSHKVAVLSTNRVFWRNASKTNMYHPEKYLRPIPEYKTEETAQESLLSSALESGKVPSTQEWISLKDSVLTKGKIINHVNFDARAINYCIAHKNLKAGKSLLQLYQSKNENLNIAALGKFLKLCHICNEENNTFNKEDEKIILSMYQKLKDQYPVLASLTAENVIPALSLTKNWKECLNLLENIKLTERPSNGSYSVIIKAAFINNEFDLGWKLILEMSNDNKFPNPSVYKIWLKVVEESNKNVVKNVELLLSYFADYEILPSRDVTDEILKILKPYSYEGSYSSITKKGVCQSCSLQLETIKINTDEFNQLKSVFMKNVIIGKNIFTKTNPEELKRFKEFVSCEKYDVVIDGLNVAYSAGNKQRPEVYAKLLANVVRHYRLNGQTILVLGREHMKRWPKQYFDYIKYNSNLFLAQDISLDDPFLLYATMSSGLGTSFLSRDFMRGHLYLLMDSNLKRLFRKWQQLYQYSLIYAERNGQIHIKSPFPHLCTTQESKAGWHIPYVDNYVPMTPMSFEPPKNWLCIKKINK